MMASRRPRQSGQFPTWIAITLVAILAIGVGALAIAAVQSTQSDPSSGETVAPAPTFTSALKPTPTPTESPEPVAPLPGQNPTEARFLAVEQNTVWRGVAGACDGTVQPLLEKSDDGGANFIDVTPLYRGVTQLLSLDAFANTEAEIITTAAAEDGDTNCTPQAMRTFTQGEFWQFYPDVLAASTYIDPAIPGSVITPAGTVAAPCTNISALRAGGGTTAVLCDGTVWVLNEGQTWDALAPEGAITLAVNADTVAIAHYDATCEGTALTRFATADLATPIASVCAEGTDIASPAAIAINGDSTVLWSGDAVSVIG